MVFPLDQDFWIGTGPKAFKRSEITLNNVKVNVKDFGAVGDGIADDKAAIQDAVNALPEKGILVFPEGRYLIKGYNQYVTIGLDRTRILGAPGAWLITENSDNPEALSDPHYCGLTITGDKCYIFGLNIQGGLISMQTNNLNVENCTFKNLHNAAIAVSSTLAFNRLTVKDCVFDTSLATDVGNYTVIQRGSVDADPWGGTVVVDNCEFIGVAGGVNMHKTRTVIIQNSKFQGIDINCIKTSIGNENLIIENNEFDGAAINPGSANRHLNSGTDYLGFIQWFDNVKITGNKAKNFSVNTLAFLDGSFIDASITIKKNRFESCVSPIYTPQGNVDISRNKFLNCGGATTGISLCEVATWGRIIKFDKNLLIDTKLRLGNHGEQGHTFVYVRKNSIKYGLDNNGAIEQYNNAPGGSEFEACFIEDNDIEITGGKTRGIYAPTSYGRNNTVTGAAGTADDTIKIDNLVYDPAITGANTFPVYPNNKATVTNNNATGNITYTLPASLPVGYQVVVKRTHATHNLYFIAAGGAIDGLGTTAFISAGASGILTKITATNWILTSPNGTVNQY